MTAADVEAVWCSLEASSDNSNFFLSWAWIGAWLRTYQPKVSLLELSAQGEVVALGLFIHKRQTRHGLLSSRTLRLHQTGCEQEDQIWIEYNGLLCAPGYESAAALATLDFFQQQDDWDELITGAMSELDLERLSTSSLHCHEITRLATYKVDLQQLTKSGQSYLDSVSRNLRYQVGLARRLYEKVAPVELVFARNLAQALEFFGELGPYHRDRWSGQAGGSGFENPKFVSFHEELIRAGWPQQQIQICRLNVGSDTVAFLYNFTYQDQVYFYLSGIKAEAKPKLKPGLLCHSMCIQHNLEAGFKTYDLMGGDMEYKRRLAKRAEDLVVASLQRPRLKLKTERWARACKGALLSALQNARHNKKQMEA